MFIGIYMNTYKYVCVLIGACVYIFYDQATISTLLTHCGREDLRKWTIFNTILTSPKSWLSQEDLDAGFEHSLMPMDS